MSIPTSLVVSKLRYPEEEETSSSPYVVISDMRKHDGVNFVHAFTNGKHLALQNALQNALITWADRFQGSGWA